MTSVGRPGSMMCIQLRTAKHMERNGPADENTGLEGATLAKSKKAKAKEHRGHSVGSEAANTPGSHGDHKMKRKEYEHELRRLHGELVAVQEWVKDSGAKICIVFEGRDTAGKGGTIKAITERVSPKSVPSRRPPRTHRPREVTDVHPTVLAALPGRR